MPVLHHDGRFPPIKLDWPRLLPLGRVLAVGPGVERVTRPGAAFQLRLEGADGHFGERPFRPAP
jgi:hypothetical protein